MSNPHSDKMIETFMKHFQESVKSELSSSMNGTKKLINESIQKQNAIKKIGGNKNKATKSTKSTKSKKGGSISSDVAKMAVPFSLLLAKESFQKYLENDKKPKKEKKTSEKKTSEKKTSEKKKKETKKRMVVMSAGNKIKKKNKNKQKKIKRKKLKKVWL